MDTLYLDETSGKLYKYQDGRFVEVQGKIQDGPPSDEQSKEMEKHQRQQAKAEQEQGNKGEQGNEQGQSGDDQDNSQQDDNANKGQGDKESNDSAEGPPENDGGGANSSNAAKPDNQQGKKQQQSGNNSPPQRQKTTAPENTAGNASGNAADDLLNKMQDLEDKLNNGEDVSDDIDDLIDKAKQAVDNAKNNASDDMKAELEDALDALEDAADRSRRLEKIKDVMSDPDVKDRIKSDNIAMADRERKKERAERRKANEKTAKEYKNESDFDGDLEAFKRDLEKFMKNEIKEVESKTWARRNRRYTNTPFIMPGKRTDKKLVIPSVGVYFDQSGSWGSNDVARGKKAIACLYELQKKGKIKFDLIYFGNTLSKDPDEVGGGTGAGKLLVEDIIKMQYDNVIIMTDDDFDGWGEIYSAPIAKLKGAAFFLFRYGLVSHGLLDHVQAPFTRVYKI